METVLNNLTSRISEIHNQVLARFKQIESAYADANSDIPFNVDRDGRWHAPCDGYISPHVDDDKVYGKGQYIPFPEIDVESLQIYQGVTGRLTSDFPHFDKGKVLFSDVQALLDVGMQTLARKYHIRVGHSKVWKQDGVQVCYVNIWTTHRSLLGLVVPAMFKAYEAKMEEVKQPEREREDAPTGRHVITGTVLSVKLQEGYYSDTWKMLVEDERGFKVWGTIPSSIGPEGGDRVTFTATLEPSEEDAKFAFYKRPTKAHISYIAAEEESTDTDPS